MALWLCHMDNPSSLWVVRLNGPLTVPHGHPLQRVSSPGDWPFDCATCPTEHVDDPADDSTMFHGCPRPLITSVNESERNCWFLWQNFLLFLVTQSLRSWSKCAACREEWQLLSKVWHKSGRSGQSEHLWSPVQRPCILTEMTCTLVVAGNNFPYWSSKLDSFAQHVVVC